MTPAERERNRAARIAYAHARRGDDRMMRAWLAAAATFAPLTDRQEAHAMKTLRDAGPVIHEGQLDILGALEELELAEELEQLDDADDLEPCHPIARAGAPTAGASAAGAAEHLPS